MRLFIRLLIVALLIIAAIIGCSKKRSNPIFGDIPNPDQNQPSGDLIAGLSDHSSLNIPLWIYSGRVDMLRNTASITPIRSASQIGDMFDSDITQFLLKNPCTDCVKLSGVGLDSTGNVVLDFKIKHPFDNISKRPDLHVFDVRAIFQSAATGSAMRITSDLNGDSNVEPSEYIRPSGNFIINADGSTTHFNTGQFTGNCHPYIRFFENPSTATFDPANPSGHNVMKVGDSWETQSFIIDTSIAPSTFQFNLVVDASYGQSAVFTTRSNPTYYLPAFNRKEAWSVEVTTVNNLLESGDMASYADLQIRVKDWQAGATVNASYPECSLGEIPYASDVKQVLIDIPGVNSVVMDTAATPSGGNGSNSNPYVFNIRVDNDLAATDGTYYGIVAVRDDLDTLEGPYGIPEGPGGFPEEEPDIRDYTAYVLFPIEVGNGGTPPPPPEGIEISGSNLVFLGDSVELTAIPDEPGGTYVWSSTSPDIEFVGSVTEPTATVRGVSSCAVVDSAAVRVDYKATEDVYDTFDMTCWGVQFTTPTANYRQYINLDGGGSNGRTITIEVQVVPSGIGAKQINWSFIDPDEPSQEPAADEAGIYESDSTGNDNRGVEDAGFGSNLSGTNPDTYVSDTVSDIAQAPFTVSTFGGDNYIIKAYPSDVSSSLAVESPAITVWRWLDIPVYSMSSSSGSTYFYEPFYDDVNIIYAGGYIHINAIRSQGNLPYNSGGATDGVIPLDGDGFWPVTEVPAIGYLLNNSNAVEGWHKVNSCGFKNFGDPSPPAVNPLNVLGIAYSYWENPEPDPFHFMYYNYFFVCTDRVRVYFGSSDDAEMHVFAHELGHTLGLPHNNLEEGDHDHDPFYPGNKFEGGIGIMDALVSDPFVNKFTRAELDFFRGDYDGPYFY